MKVSSGGVFGSAGDRAVRTSQRARDLVVDGKADTAICLTPLSIPWLLSFVGGAKTGQHVHVGGAACAGLPRNPAPLDQGVRLPVL